MYVFFDSSEHSWFIANVSNTRPLSLNGRELANGERAGVADGDAIGLGSVPLSVRLAGDDGDEDDG